MSRALAKLGEIAPAKPIRLEGFNLKDKLWQITLDHIESNTGQLIKKVKKPLSEAGSSTHAFDSRHVLYSKLRPYLNKVLLPNEIGLGTTELIPMLPDASKLDRVYLAHYLKSYKFVSWISSQTAGVKMPRVSMKVFWAHEIPLPPLKEQKRIAAILDKADNLRRKRQQTIQLADEFLRAVFLDMFGDPVTNPKQWEVKTLKSISKRFSDGPFGSKLKSEHYVKCGVRVIRLQNIGVGKFKDKDKAYISKKYYEDALSKFSCSSGDIIIGTLGDPNVRACLIPKHIELAVNKADCVHFIPDESVARREYLVSLLNLPQFLHFFSGLLHGQTRTRVSSGQLGKVEIPIPPIDIQNKFIKINKQITKNLSKMESSIQSITNLFNSISQRSFSGEL